MLQFEVREAVTFTNHDQKIFGILHKPLIAPPFPVVVICHGFAGTKSGQFRHYVRLAESLSQAGIASLRFDFRGSGDSEGDLLESTIEGQIEDTIAAISLVKKNPNFDPERIGLLGRSLGGPIAICAAKETGVVKSLALWVPLFSSAKWREKWQEMQANPDAKSTVKELVHFNGFLPSKDFLSQFFALDVARELEDLAHIPLLHLSALQDDVVTEVHTEAYRNEREKASAPTRFFSFADSGHDFSPYGDQAEAISMTTKWFQETL